MTMMMMQRILDGQASASDKPVDRPQQKLPFTDNDNDTDNNCDIEIDNVLSPVDLTRQRDHEDEFETQETNSNSSTSSNSSAKRHATKSLAFSVENILDPNKFNGCQQSQLRYNGDPPVSQVPIFFKSCFHPWNFEKSSNFEYSKWFFISKI